jgi:hypothetical protein
VGTVDALVPIVLFRYSLTRLQSQLIHRETLNLEGFPITGTRARRKFMFLHYSIDSLIWFTFHRRKVQAALRRLLRSSLLQTKIS